MKKFTRMAEIFERKIILFLMTVVITLGSGKLSAGSEELSTKQPAGIEIDSNLKFVSLSLKESIVYALRNNFDIEVSKLNSKISDYDITKEKSRFDPVFKVTGNIQNNETPSTNLLQLGNSTKTTIRPYVMDQNAGSAVLQSLVPTGATLYLSYNIARNYYDPSPFQLLNPVYTNYIEAGLTQPLLKGGSCYRTSRLLSAKAA